MSTVNHAVTTLLVVLVAIAVTWRFGATWMRLWGLGAMLVAFVFTLIQASLNKADLGSYLAYGVIALAGLTSWLLGHRLHATQGGRWRSSFARQFWAWLGLAAE